MHNSKELLNLGVAAAGLMAVFCARPVIAGNTTSVGSTGNGWVYSDLVYGTQVFSKNGNTNQAIAKPASAVNYGAKLTYAPTGNNAVAANLPPGAITAGATSFYSQATTVFLTGGYKGQARASVASPATAENPALQAELINRGFVLQGAKCGAQYNIASGGELDPVSGKKYLIVYGTATDGTAAWFQGYAGGKKLYDVLITGPFDFGDESNACKALRVPFDYNGSIDDVTFLADTVALTATDLAFVKLPSALTVECPATVQAPAGIGTTGGCGQATLIYSPDLGTPLSLGKTTVTVSAVDGVLNQIVGSYDITVVDTTAPIPPILSPVIGECSATVTPPTTTDACAGTITGTTPDPLIYTSQGTYTLHWTFNDGHGNSSTANQTVIVKDTQAPVPIRGTAGGSLPAATGQCSTTVSTAPTAVDNCAGTVTATGTIGGNPITLPYTKITQGTVTITWTYDDGNGNTSTQTQNVTVHDTTPPVISPSSLTTVTGDCSSGPVSLPTPAVVDNCSGTVTVLASPVGPYSTSTTVTWTATDAAGNKSTATQQVVFNGYQFHGFYDPINGVGGACNAPIPNSSASAGSTVQIKFDVLNCSGARATGVVPHVRIYKDSVSCTETLQSEGDASVVNGQWHFQWNTAKADKGKTFRIGVSLPGTDNFGNVYITLK